MLNPGDSLQGRYTVDQMLGQGGRGIVYLARQDLLGGRRVAIKETHFDFVLPEEHAEAVAQFHREARLLASLNHPNLVDVKDFFEENGNLYLVMDFVEGETFEEILERSNGTMIQLDSVYGWADQLCDVLECLHAHQPPIIFRDLKPGNIMLDSRGNCRLIDFGIARVLEAESRDLTERAGTVGYAPYEQHAGKEPDARTDIYALGATLYDLLTGHPPPSAVAIRTGEETLEQPSELNPSVPPSLESCILKMMSTRPEDRYQTVLEVRKALRLAMKTGSTGIVRRISLDGGDGRRKMSPLDDPGKKKFTFMSPGKTEPPPAVVAAPLGPPPEPIAPEPEEEDVIANLPPVEIKKSGGVFGWFRKDPILVGAWVLDTENRPAKVAFRRYRDGVMTFTSNIVHPPNQPMTLNIQVKNLRPEVQAVACHVIRRLMADDQVQYEVRAQQISDVVDELLRRHFGGEGVTEAGTKEERRAPRINSAFQVMSRDLPGFKALSTNISLTGIQLDVREEVKKGKKLQMKLDFDDFRFKEIDCEGEVMWCRPGEKDWLIGISFLVLSEPARETIQSYIQYVSGGGHKPRM